MECERSRRGKLRGAANQVADGGSSGNMCFRSAARAVLPLLLLVILMRLMGCVDARAHALQMGFGTGSPRSGSRNLNMRDDHPATASDVGLSTALVGEDYSGLDGEKVVHGPNSKANPTDIAPNHLTSRNLLHISARDSNFEPDIESSPSTGVGDATIWFFLAAFAFFSSGLIFNTYVRIGMGSEAVRDIDRRRVDAMRAGDGIELGARERVPED